MIAPAKQTHSHWHHAFLAMLPAIQTHARVAFAGLDREAREEAVAEVTANALVAFVRLVQTGKADVAYPTVLARYGVAQYREGRRVATKSNCKDITSEYCQLKKKLNIERLDRFDPEDGWQEAVVEDKTAGPAEIAATRIDFAAWLSSLPGRTRKIARALATGETTHKAARRFMVSPARISQVRRELKESWEKFHDQEVEPVDMPALNRSLALFGEVVG